MNGDKLKLKQLGLEILMLRTDQEMVSVFKQDLMFCCRYVHSGLNMRSSMISVQDFNVVKVLELS
ncbi:CLUMA_CG018876, isoform A [Clunio marinus]|uniref:CLUMA_CG018876, isoform A n=1 Tax=Clunio marinus TaxID=568069 RepID=A0A1J1J1M9_9DIPT|nr:CLUMA_CG018876, isoform A [Clunio marinus]